MIANQTNINTPIPTRLFARFSFGSFGIGITLGLVALAICLFGAIHLFAAMWRGYVFRQNRSEALPEIVLPTIENVEVNEGIDYEALLIENVQQSAPLQFSTARPAQSVFSNANEEISNRRYSIQ